MKLASKSRESFLVVQRDICGHLGPEVDLRVAVEHRGLVVIPLFPVTARVDVPVGYEMHRYLDVFFVILPSSDDQLRQEAVDDFFDWLAPRYEEVIDIDGNVENINQLLALLRRGLGDLSQCRLLDFGCGTGLSLGPIADAGAMLIGFDTCPIMRRIAAARGMDVIGPEDFLAPGGPSFDGVFTSYVLHFEPAYIWLDAAWRRLRLGGVFAGNCHKGDGFDYTHCVMRTLGGDLKIDHRSARGLYVYCVKDRESK